VLEAMRDVSRVISISSGSLRLIVVSYVRHAKICRLIRLYVWSGISSFCCVLHLFDCQASRTASYLLQSLAADLSTGITSFNYLRDFP
jgi:hypothetical protein